MLPLSLRTALLVLGFLAAPRFLSFFEHFGLLGLFLVSIVDSSFVPLPIPGVTDVMLIVFAASHANPVWLIVISTFGSALGGYFSHLVGQAGGMSFLESHVPARILAPVTRWMESHTLIAIALPAILPPPMPLSPFVLAAGALNMSRRKFLTAFTLSRLARHTIAAWLGLRYGPQVLGLWSRVQARWGTPILITLWTIILLSVAFAFWKLYRTTRTVQLPPLRRHAQPPPPGAPSAPAVSSPDSAG